MKIADSHNDIFYRYKRKSNMHKYLDKIKKHYVKLIFCAYFSYNNDKILLDDIKSKFDFVKSLSRNYIPTIENLWFVTPKNLDYIIDLKPFCVTLSHNLDNYLCGGAFGYNGLSNWGKNVVCELENNNIIIDTAHMNLKSFYDFINITSKPIFNSHTGFKSIFNHKRNIDNQQLDLIKQSEGYVGIAFYPNFWGDKNIDCEYVYNKINSLISFYGSDIFGIGTDFNGIDKYICGLGNYKELSSLYNKLKLNNSINIANNIFYNNLTSFVKPYISH